MSERWDQVEICGSFLPLSGLLARGYFLLLVPWIFWLMMPDDGVLPLGVDKTLSASSG